MKRKTAVITGASSGIGLELARLFAADGYDLIVAARRLDRLHQLADELGKDFGCKVNAIGMDLAQPFAATELWQAICTVTPEVDVLVNDAGFGDCGDFARQQPEIIERMIHLNIATLTSLTRLALPGMIERKRGNILNVASLVGYQPGGPGMAVYYASKSYVISFSRGIRRELKGTGVSVTVLAPGTTSTEFEEIANAQDTWLFHWTKPMEAGIVARAGYRGMQRGACCVIPGLLNKLLAISAKLSPSSIVLEINRILLSKRH